MLDDGGGGNAPRRVVMRATISEEREIEALIDSREWWIFVGGNPLFDEIESRFFPNEGEFVTVIGPVLKRFAGVIECPWMVLHFGRKTSLSEIELTQFINNHPDRVGLPAIKLGEDRDIIFALVTDR
jgi:hypothetical protein